jgi:hypothetical protein
MKPPYASIAAASARSERARASARSRETVSDRSYDAVTARLAP